MLTLSNSVSFSHGAVPAVGLTNFWEPEDGFVWSTDRWCEVTFDAEVDRTDAPFTIDLILDLDVFKPGDGEGQNIFAYVNGLRLSSTFVQRRVVTVITMNASQIRPKDNVLVLDTPDSVKPSAFGSNDTRTLGMQLFSIQIRAAD